MIPIHSMTLDRTRRADGVRVRTRLERRDDGAWDLTEERFDRETKEWSAVGHEVVQGVTVDGDLHGSFGRREWRRDKDSRDDIAGAEAEP